MKSSGGVPMKRWVVEELLAILSVEDGSRKEKLFLEVWRLRRVMTFTQCEYKTIPSYNYHSDYGNLKPILGPIADVGER
jgi:hypothetical protein